eukprot:3544722-Pleurochrysis_carterae.AAC.2
MSFNSLEAAAQPRPTQQLGLHTFWRLDVPRLRALVEIARRVRRGKGALGQPQGARCRRGR